MAERIVPVMNELRSKGIKFAGVSMDNEATSNALFDELQQHFDFILHSPCSAHLIQLCVNSVMQHPTVKPNIDKMIDLIREVASNKALRLQIRAMALREGLRPTLSKPCPVRWNSTLNSITELCKLKKVVRFYKGTHL
jgi:hypothetical protein